MRVVDHIVEFLSTIGVSHIFGVDGANIEDLYDAAHFHADLTAVLAKHEFSAATMADGYSRGGGGLGVLAATSGGGAMNTVPGLAEARASRVPVLAVIGQPPTTLEGLGAFQDTSGRNGALDARDLFASVSVFCRRVTTPADIVVSLPAAVTAARDLRGPAVLLLPKDIQQSDLPAAGPHCGDIVAAPRSADPHPIAQALRRAAGPVTIIAGEQVARDDARDELEELRALLRAQVATVPEAKDVAGTPGRGSSSALGVTGVMGHPGVASALTDSALCLLIGTRMNVTAGAGLDDALASVPVFSLGCAEPYRPCTHVHTDDLRRSLATLVAALSGEGRPLRLRVPEALPRSELPTQTHPGPGVRYRDAMLALDELLPAGVDIVVDAGNTGAAAIHHLPARRDGRFIVALGMGGMGYSFGAAIGNAFARGSRVVVIAGDGSFYMHGMEIHTALQYRLPITFCLFDNHAHAMCVTREQIFYGARYSYNRFGESRLGAGLRAMFPSLPATDVTDVAGLRAALSAALEAGGPAVISIECSADEIPPFIPFLAHPPRPEGAHRDDSART